MYRAIGIFPDQPAVDAYPHWFGAKPGDVIFEDVSGDNKINADDKILLDFCDIPEITYSVSLNAGWKAFTLSVLLQGQGKLFVFDWMNYDVHGEGSNYFKWTYDNWWTPTNTNTTIARAFNRNDFYWAPYNNYSTYWWDNSAFCRLKNLIFAYNIPTRLIKSLGISKASFYFSGNNLALLYSAKKKYDPELNVSADYPVMKTFAIGANVTF